MTELLDPRLPGTFNRSDYFERLAELRADAPVHQIDDDVFTVARYEEVRTISRNPTDFCSSRGLLVNRDFTPRGVCGLETRIRELVAEVLDGRAS